MVACLPDASMGRSACRPACRSCGRELIPPGDSGGSVYQETGNDIAAAAGIISARVTYADGAVRLAYSHIEYITRDLNVQIQTDN
jgi:hypothetical protein